MFSSRALPIINLRKLAEILYRHLQISSMDHRVPIQDETAAIKVTVESVSFFKDLAFRTRCKKKEIIDWEKVLNSPAKSL